MNYRSTITTSALAIAGFGLWSYAGSQLKNGDKFDYNPNPLGLKRSPYGQVIAMAIQAPIDADWHGTLEIHDMPSSGEDDHNHDVCEDESCDHDHEHELAEHDQGCSDPDCHEDHGTESKPKGSLIDRLSKAVTQRNNPHPPTEGHKFYIRREIEKKLRFAYDLDPSHYANYAAYNLFLTESSLGTAEDSQEEVSKNVTQLAEITIRYCLRESEDPRPSLTAASAAYNALERQFINQENYKISEMRERLSVLDFCLRQHFALLQKSINNDNFSRLSEMRQKEIVDRSKFALKLREASEKTISRLDKERSASSTVQLDPS